MPYVDPSWFYWVQIIEGISFFFTVMVLIVFIILAAAFTVVTFSNFDEWEEEQIKIGYKLLKWGVITLFVSLFLSIFLPTKETMFQMKLAENITHENVNAATETIKDTVDYIFEKMGK